MFQVYGFQDLACNFSFSGVDFRIWDEVLVSVVSNFMIRVEISFAAVSVLGFG